MFTYRRPVRFEDVDAARIVFFSRFLNYGHEAMEALFASLDGGGYVGLVLTRKIGLPAVHVEADFKAPLRYGDVARLDVDVPRIGTKSCTLRYTVYREPDGAHAATILHVCATTDLAQMRAIPLPDDVRAVLAQHAAT